MGLNFGKIFYFRFVSFRFSLLRYVFFFRNLDSDASCRPDDLPGQSLQRQVPGVVVSLLDQRDVVDHLRRYVRRGGVRHVGRVRPLRDPRGPLDEPRRRRAADGKGVGPVRHGPQLDPQGCVLFVDFSGLVVEVLAKLGHVDPQRTEGLSDGRSGFGGCFGLVC